MKDNECYDQRDNEKRKKQSAKWAFVNANRKTQKMRKEKNQNIIQTVRGGTTRKKHGGDGKRRGATAVLPSPAQIGSTIKVSQGMLTPVGLDYFMGGGRPPIKTEKVKKL